MDLVVSEPFAHRPQALLPARIRCAAIPGLPTGDGSRCATSATVAVDLVCRSCGTRRAFLCAPCLDEARWEVGSGLVWCARDGARVTALVSQVPLTVSVPGG